MALQHRVARRGNELKVSIYLGWRAGSWEMSGRIWALMDCGIQELLKSEERPAHDFDTVDSRAASSDRVVGCAAAHCQIENSL